MLVVLEGFNPHVDRQSAGKTAWSAGDGGWEWPPVEGSLEVIGMWPIKEYIQRR